MFAGIGISSETYAKDIIPVRPNVTQTTTIGMYQVGDDVKIYKEPNEDSQILYRVRWNNDEFFPSEIGFDNFLQCFCQRKTLRLLV